MKPPIQDRLCCLEKSSAEFRAWMDAQSGNDVIVYADEDYLATRAGLTIVADSTNGPFNVTLPEATDFEGGRITVKRWGTAGSNVTILTSNGDDIDGEVSMLLGNDYASLSFRASNSAWLITASYNMS